MSGLRRICCAVPSFKEEPDTPLHVPETARVEFADSEALVDLSMIGSKLRFNLGVEPTFIANKASDLKRLGLNDPWQDALSADSL